MNEKYKRLGSGGDSEVSGADTQVTSVTIPVVDTCSEDADKCLPAVPSSIESVTKDLRSGRFFPLLVFVISGGIVILLGVIFTLLTSKTTVNFCFLAIGCSSIVMGFLFQFRGYVMQVLDTCGILERCYVPREENENVKRNDMF